MTAEAPPAHGWLTPPEAALLIGGPQMAPSTVNRWINDGAVPTNALLKIGKTRYRIARWWAEGRRP